MPLTLEQRAIVTAEAVTWIGTPYHPHARIKGVGVDCAHILCAVYEAAGVTSEIDPGWYAPDWHLHRNEEVYLGWLQRYCVQTKDPQPGDVLIFRFGRTFSHSAILVEPDVAVHAYVGRGVILTRLTEEPLVDRESLAWSLK